jgi:ClpP class serine protease
MSARKRVLREIRWSAKATMKLFAFALLASSVATAAFGMSFKVKKFDFRPMRGITYEVYATGESVKGDTEALTQALQSANVTDADILINLNSPGGSVVEALKRWRASCRNAWRLPPTTIFPA